MTYINHLILNISNYKKSKSFYDTLMKSLEVESRIVHEDDKYKIQAYQIPGCPLYIRFARDEEKKDFVRNIGLDHFAIGVESKEKVDEIHDLIKSTGSTVTVKPKTYPEYGENYYAFYFRDPDGFPLEIVYNM